jgi:acetyl/propionyl-CoA carboxylase alpha subunit
VEGASGPHAIGPASDGALGPQLGASQPVLILEASKVEQLLTAPRSGVVEDFKFQLGDHVTEGVELATIETGPPPDSAS